MIIVLPSAIGLIILAVISAFLYIIKNPEKVDKWGYIYYKFIARRSELAERKVISKNLDYKITSIAKRINNESDGIIPFGLRIKWSNPDNIESYVKENEVVVVLRREDNNDKNIINACTAFVPKALLPKSRNCLDPQVLRSLDNYMVKSILFSGNYDSTYNYYLQNIFNPLINSDIILKNYITDFEKLNEIGFFTRLLLEEFRRMGNKLYGTYTEQNFMQESIDFIKFLENFAARNPGDKTKLFFQGEIIKISIVLIAKKKTLNTSGIETYFNGIERSVDKGAMRIFVFSYSQRYDECAYDANGYVQDVTSKREFTALNELEKKCRESEKIRLIKKQKYSTKDVQGNKRAAKYLVYEAVR
jgi:hypothetical protein